MELATMFATFGLGEIVVITVIGSIMLLKLLRLAYDDRATVRNLRSENEDLRRENELLREQIDLLGGATSALPVPADTRIKPSDT